MRSSILPGSVRSQMLMSLSMLVLAACGSAGATDAGDSSEGAGAASPTGTGGSKGGSKSSTGGTSSNAGGASSQGGTGATGGTSSNTGGTSSQGGTGANTGGASSQGGTGTNTGGTSSNAGGMSQGGTSSQGGTGAGNASGSGGTGGVCAAGTLSCNGNTQVTCDGMGGFTDPMACMIECIEGTGCAVCAPGVGTCDGNVATLCRQDGTGSDMMTCDNGCMDGVCLSACQTGGTVKRSYIGCDYYPTVTSNMDLLEKFDFAAVVGNTTNQTANVIITQGTNQIAMGQIPPGMTSTFKLPWVDALKGKMLALSLASVLVPSGAYHLSSDQPVTVYQFNPLEYQIPGSCPLNGSIGGCFSFTNDASLLLPSNALGTEYIVASHAPRVDIDSMSGSISDIPGLLAVTATQDMTTVMVTSSAHTRKGTGINAMAPGDTQSFMLNAGDVLQILSDTPSMNDVSNCQYLDGDSSSGDQVCDVTPAYDLTGSYVQSDKPVSVIGGHDCDNIPFNYAACDHLEQVMFPLVTWGTQVIATPPQSVKGAKNNDGKPDLYIVRVISGADGNAITIDNAPPGTNMGTLNKGQFADIPQSTDDMVINGTGPIMVVQYMLGADLVDPGAVQSVGDPSMSLAVPVSQYRDNYTFLAPDSYEYSFVNVIAPSGASIQLDGGPVGGSPTPIGSSGYVVTRKAVAGKSHTITGDMPFGILVYGYGAYTSYMYPGGLNLQ